MRARLAQSIERSRDELISLRPKPQHAPTRSAALQRSIDDRVIVVDDDAPRPGGRRR
jgi:hypothetical protein